jgi:signal peptidase II
LYGDVTYFAQLYLIEGGLVRLGKLYRTIYDSRMNAPTSLPPDVPDTDISSASHQDNCIPLSRWIVFFTIAVVGAASDLLTKQAVFKWRGLPGQSEIWWLIDGYVGVETAVNIGAVFGLGAGQGALFAGLSIIAAGAILIWLFWFKAATHWWLTIAMGCVLGGIIGNLYDRLGIWWMPGLPIEWKTGVRDWILWQAGDKYKWPNFNIADSLLVCGAGMLLWQSFFPDDEHDAVVDPKSTDPFR